MPHSRASRGSGADDTTRSNRRRRRGGGDLASREIDRDRRLAARHGVGRQIAEQRVDVLDRAAGGVREGRVVALGGGARRARPHVRDDVGDVGVREEPSHRVDVEPVEVGRVQLLVVRPEEALGDALAEPPVEHLAERARRAVAGGPEVQLDQAVEEVVVRQLVDVLLEREVDVAAGIADRAAPDHGADLVAGHAGAQPGLDRRVAEVEEVARVVPHEAVLHHRTAVAAGLGFASSTTTPAPGWRSRHQLANDSPETPAPMTTVSPAARPVTRASRARS